MEHRCGVKLAGVKPVGKLGKVNITCEKLWVLKLLKPTDNLTRFPAESRAVLRAGWLPCLFCGFGYFFFPCWLPAICSSRNVVAFQSQFQITDMPAPAPSKALPGREAAGSSPNLQCCFSSSRCCSASWGCWPRQGEKECGSRRDSWGTGSVVYLVPWGGFVGQKSVLFEEERIWGAQLWRSRTF